MSLCPFVGTKSPPTGMAASCSNALSLQALLMSLSLRPSSCMARLDDDEDSLRIPLGS